jgi:hypothetical protein
LHWTVIELVLSDEVQDEPIGTGPSPTVSATVAVPAVVHVKRDVAEVGLSSVPLDADHEYVRALGSGPAAIPETVTDDPTVAWEGLAATLVAAAQLYVDPLGRVTTAPAVATLQPIATLTGVVAPGATLNVAEPLQTTLPSLATADKATL